MSQRNKNNSIVFLTTLSVYLGLVLVGGAAPQILAQQTEIISRQSKTSEVQGLKGSCSEKSIAEILAIIAKHGVTETQLTFRYRIDYSENKSPNLEILFAEGDKLLVESLRQVVTCNVNLHKQFENAESEDKNAKDFAEAILKASLPFDSIFCDIKTNNQEIFSEITYSFATKEQAKNYAQSVDNQTRKINSSELIIKNRTIDFISRNSTVRYENNQAFIVTRLPRGSLDELLKQNAKAEK